MIAHLVLEDDGTELATVELSKRRLRDRRTPLEIKEQLYDFGNIVAVKVGSETHLYVEVWPTPQPPSKPGSYGRQSKGFGELRTPKDLLQKIERD
jgi:hypothetical protein